MGLLKLPRYSAPHYEDQACRTAQVYGCLEGHIHVFHLGKYMGDFRFFCLLYIWDYCPFAFFVFFLDKKSSAVDFLMVLYYIMDVMLNGR